MNQAEGLDRIMQELKSNALNPPPRRPPRVIAVTGGKGGVGKSCVSVNLGLALAKAGRDTLLLDADLGLANVDVLLGLQPKCNIANLLAGECSLEELVLPAAHGLKVVPATSGKRSMVDMTRAEYAAVHSWSRAPLRWAIERDGERVTEGVGERAGTRSIRVTMHDDSGFEKIVTLHDDGALRVEYRWDASVFPADAIFAPELSCAREVDVQVEVPEGREVVVWRHPIETVAKSEKGLERTVQGISITPCIPVRAGTATVIVSVGTSSGTGTAD